MLNIGVIGAGRMGLNHSRNLRQLDTIKLAGVYDILPEKATAYANEFGAKIYQSPEELINAKDIGLIIITSPTYCHIEALRIALDAHKPIFCEKPLCRTQEELDELIPLITNYDNFFALGFVRRYSPNFAKMKEVVDSGELGKLLCGEIRCLHGRYVRMHGDWFADYDKCGGVMLDMLAHHVDLQNHLIGEAESIYAQSFMLNQNEDELPFDYVSATARFKNGFISNIQCSWLRNAPSDTEMTICGDKASITFSDSKGLLLTKGGKTEKIPVDEAALNIHKIQGGMYAEEMAYIVDAVINGKKPLAGAKEAIDAMTFCFGMMASAETGKLVKF